MKITIEVDCTPEEARRFFGLSDAVPVQQAIMDYARAFQAARAAINLANPTMLSTRRRL
jgi:hypothetical protein